MLRYVDHDQATVWVETARPATVTVSAVSATDPADRHVTREPTWTVHGHHYALVQLTQLRPDTVYPYTVHLDDQAVWPEPSSPYPPSVIRTLGHHASLRLAFGSCRRTAPFDAQGLRDKGADALAALAGRMGADPYERWPDALLMVGDQIYADEPSPELTDRLLAAHADAGPGRREIADEVWNFEEYTWLYHESWSPEPIRWLLSRVPTCMVLDDHDLRDDWNTSWRWRQHVTGRPWWRDRVTGAFASYWVYQHLGNLSPTDLATDAMFAAVRGEVDDQRRTAALDDFAWRADAQVGSARWSFVRDFGDENTSVRLVAIDCRASRHLGIDERAMVDDREWSWIVEQATAAPHGAATHVLFGTPLPLLLPRGVHHLEGWNEALADGSHSARVEGFAERLRQLVDLEHWAAFRSSFGNVVELLQTLCAAPDPPVSILFLSGDVHCSYVARAHLAHAHHPETVIGQLTMSPFRNPLPRALRAVNRLAERPWVRRATRRLSRSVGVPDVGLDWDLTHGPWFDNGVMMLELLGRQARLEVDRADHDGERQFLRRVTTVQLT